MISLLQLREPGWLVLAALPGVLLASKWFWQRWQQSHYADAHLYDWVISKHSALQKIRWWQLLFTQLTWLAFAIAMAGPRIPVKYLDSQEQYTNQLYVVVDLSSSMSVTDVQPTRIERIKLELLDLTERLSQTRMGLIVYAAHAHVLSPPTTDKAVLRHYIQSLRTGLLPTAGSQTLTAIEFATKQFSTDDANSKAILLISDGEHNLTAQQLSDAMQQLSTHLQSKQIHLYTLGIGTAQGAAILTADSGWLNYDNQAVVTHLNSEFLLSLATLGNGKYQYISNDDSDWQALYDQGIAKLPFATTEQEQEELVQWHELASVFIVAGLFCLFIALWQPKPHHVQTLLLMSFFYLTLLPLSPPANAADADYAAAYQLYQQGDFTAARKAFMSLPGFNARFAEASSSYQLQEYKQAIPVYIQAIVQAKTDQQRVDAIFNLANSYFKLEQYTEASLLYQDVLRYQPQHRAAAINLEYALELAKQTLVSASIKAQREGTGPRTADAPPNMDIERGRLSLGEATNNETPQPAVEPDTSQHTATTMLLQQSRPASEQVEYRDDPSWTYDINTLSELVQQQNSVSVDESILWQRLFELEEGFMAAQEEPRQLPGIKPW